jgi:hypothetical protein
MLTNGQVDIGKLTRSELQELDEKGLLKMPDERIMQEEMLNNELHPSLFVSLPEDVELYLDSTG